MLTRWLTFTAFLAGSATPQGAATGQDAVSVAPTCRVKGHPQVQLALNCGDGKNAGVVLYWHTPFGELRSQGFQSKLDPVFVHRDGSLVIPDSSVLHSGLYYCLLQHTGGTTLWPYELHVDQNRQRNREPDGYEQSSSCATVRFSGGEKQTGAGVSQEQFAGAVAASVLLTFVLGFSTGALSRTHVLRCLRAVTRRLQSPRQQTDTVDYGSEVTMTTVPPVSQAFEMGQMQDDDSMTCASVDTATSSSASSPPAKPQRSFRQKRDEQLETAACPGAYNYKKEEEAEEAGREGQEETDDKKCREDRQGKDGEVSREEEEEVDVHEGNTKEDGEQNRGSEEAAGGDKEKRGGHEKREEEEGCTDEKEGDDREETRREEEEGCTDEKEGDDREEMRREEDSQSSTDTEDDETGDKTQGESGPSSQRRPARRSRVIRLYQYDEDGQRYCHLPDPAPNDTGPAPRTKQRSVSLTRLNTIMAAATAGPLDRRETGREEEEKSQFHMDI